jgi:hypothetical protein
VLLGGKRRRLGVGAHRAMATPVAQSAAMAAAPGLQNLDKRTRGGGVCSSKESKQRTRRSPMAMAWWQRRRAMGRANGKGKGEEGWRRWPLRRLGRHCSRRRRLATVVDNAMDTASRDRSWCARAQSVGKATYS